jgi:YVTN family beta-propeller protein
MRRLAAPCLVLALSVVLLGADSPAKVGQKLYVTNSAGDDVTIVDPATNKPIGRIEVGPHPHGIAVPAAQDVVYVTIEGNGKDKPGELLWIDPQTDKVTRRLPIGPEPNQLAVTPDGKFAYVPVNDGHYEVIDLAAAKIVERIQTGGRPHNTLCSADGKHMYLAPMGAPKKVIIVDTANHKVIGNVPFTSVVRPIALTRETAVRQRGRPGRHRAGRRGSAKDDPPRSGRAGRRPEEVRQPQPRPGHPARPEGNLGVRRRAQRGPHLRHHRRQAEADRHCADR